MIKVKRKANPNLLLKQLPYAMRGQRCGNLGRIRLIVGGALGYDVNPLLSVP